MIFLLPSKTVFRQDFQSEFVRVQVLSQKCFSPSPRLHLCCSVLRKNTFLFVSMTKGFVVPRCCFFLSWVYKPSFVATKPSLSVKEKKDETASSLQAKTSLALSRSSPLNAATLLAPVSTLSLQNLAGGVFSSLVQDPRKPTVSPHNSGARHRGLPEKYERQESPKVTKPLLLTSLRNFPSNADGERCKVPSPSLFTFLFVPASPFLFSFFFAFALHFEQEDEKKKKKKVKRRLKSKPAGKPS